MGELKVALSTQDRKRLTKPPPSEGGGFQSLRSKSDKSQRKRERIFGEMEMLLEVQTAIDQGLISANQFGEIHISEVLRALEMRQGF